jgi:hypothetical protein
MPLLTIPSDSIEVPLWNLLVEVNHCHGPGRGHPCKAGEGSVKGRSTGSKAAAGAGTSYARPKVLQVSNLDEALRRIRAGQVVELRDHRAVNTLLDKLAIIAREAEAAGEDAPDYDLCKVTVKGSNLFCHDRLRTKEHPAGVPRIHMPQFGGTPLPGTAADKLPKDKKGNVDGGDAFEAHLKSLGIPMERAQVPAAKLKATQAELIGTKVAGMMTARTYDPGKKSIFVSRDGYVIDGHHRWAAVVGRDAKDNRLGDSKMNIIRVDAPISEVLKIANAWATEFGIAPKSAKAKKKAA